MSSYDSAAPADGNVVLYRLGELASQVRDLIRWRGEVDVERERLRNSAKDQAETMAELKKSVDTLRKTILGFALTVAAAAITFALTVLSSAGKI